MVQTVVDPLMCGLAGFGSIQLYLPDQGVHEFIDFHGKAPSTATPDMWKDLIEWGWFFITTGNQYSGTNQASVGNETGNGNIDK